MYCCSYQVCLVLHKLLHRMCVGQCSPFGTNLLIWIQDSWNFFGTSKSLPFSWYKYTEEGINLHLPENPAIRKAKFLCNGNRLAKPQEAGNMWKPSEQCKQNKLCHTQLWQDCAQAAPPDQQFQGNSQAMIFTEVKTNGLFVSHFIWMAKVGHLFYLISVGWIFALLLRLNSGFLFLK